MYAMNTLIKSEYVFGSGYSCLIYFGAINLRKWTKKASLAFSPTGNSKQERSSKTQQDFSNYSLTEIAGHIAMWMKSACQDNDWIPE
jgi:hypothetical protein